MKRGEVMNGIAWTAGAMLDECKRVKATMLPDDAPNPGYTKLLDATHEAFLKDFRAGAYEPEAHEVGLDGMSTHEALARVEKLKAELAAQLLEHDDCDGSA